MTSSDFRLWRERNYTLIPSGTSFSYQKKAAPLYLRGKKVCLPIIVVQKNLFQYFKRYVTARNKAVTYRAEVASSQRTRALLATTFISIISKSRGEWDFGSRTHPDFRAKSRDFATRIDMFCLRATKIMTLTRVPFAFTML